MHKASVLRMEWFLSNFATKLKSDRVRILDVGSYDVNGSYKYMFDASKYDYVGMDIAAGPNVDIVFENPYNWTEIETDSFDIVISGQTFEHTEFFWVTIAEMARVLKKGGLLCIIAPHGLPQHRHPVDCYRFFPDGMVAMARYVCLDVLHAHTDCAPADNYDYWFSKSGADSMLVAQKPYNGVAQYVNLMSYKCVPSDLMQLRSGLITIEEVNTFTSYYIFTKIKQLLRKFPRLIKKIKWKMGLIESLY